MRFQKCIGWLLFLAAATGVFAVPQASDYFAIEVVDNRTGRGVPMVELRTTSAIRLYTDSNGIAAFYEPGLMNQKVFFHVESPGYQFNADGFQIRGTALGVRPGTTATLKITRQNIAERLYRVTGQGIYRDSILCGRKVPIANPVLNSRVCGQDSVNNGMYQGKLYWFWGDTSRIEYALGQFATSGATSLLPGLGGLLPEQGVDLSYLTDQSGFSRKMVPLNESGLVWIDGVMTVVDKHNREQLLCHYTRLKDLGHVLERGISRLNPEKQIFEPVTRYIEMPYSACGHAAPVLVDKARYWYFTVPFPAAVQMRVKASYEAAIDPNQYEVFTALGQSPASAGFRWIVFDKLVSVFGSRKQAQEALSGEHHEFRFYNADGGKVVEAHGGSVYWNTWLNQWVMIFNQSGGESSNLGEVWFACADTPTGPWAYARKIVTHDRYSFYNPKQHPYFNQDNGRLIYFEGTYSTTFSGDPRWATPGYDYNQMMYRLDLSDVRLCPPQAVYEAADENGTKTLLTGSEARLQQKTEKIHKVAWFTRTVQKQDAAPATETLENPAKIETWDWQARPDTEFYAIPKQVQDKIGS